MFQLRHLFLLGFFLGLLVLAPAGQLRAADTDAAPDAAAKPTGRAITLGDFGAEDLAYLAIPATPPSLGIVLVPDAYGLDDFTKREADRLAGEGYLVVAIDIYNGRLTTDPGDIANLTANLNNDTVMKTVTAGIRFFHESPKFRVDHVVAMGWGVGATYVFQAAYTNKTLDGAIIFYGPVGTHEQAMEQQVTPLCAVYPEHDLVATHESVQAFEHEMKDAGNDCEAWFVDAGRGWSNPKSKTYNPAEDREAWKVAMPFIVRIGALPVKPKDGSIIDKAKNSIENIFK